MQGWFYIVFLRRIQLFTKSNPPGCVLWRCPRRSFSWPLQDNQAAINCIHLFINRGILSFRATLNTIFHLQYFLIIQINQLNHGAVIGPEDGADDGHLSRPSRLASDARDGWICFWASLLVLLLYTCLWFHVSTPLFFLRSQLKPTDSRSSTLWWPPQSFS
jgi:hypothetical protein